MLSSDVDDMDAFATRRALLAPASPDGLIVLGPRRLECPNRVYRRAVIGDFAEEDVPAIDSRRSGGCIQNCEPLMPALESINSPSECTTKETKPPMLRTSIGHGRQLRPELLFRQVAVVEHCPRLTFCPCPGSCERHW
ncbi:hypothetical protein ACCO45_002787 [Purpureocillium lilacinum]|uniref:Uncharacterized protein n=1 Tax=Purpureocillium lilacinum TaxID=33203 RepID=A0ACC4DY47_PURLI